MQDGVTRATETRSVLLAFIAITVGAGVFTAALRPPPVRFQPLGLGDVAHLLIPLCLIAVLVERVLEVLLTAWRGASAAELKDRLRRGCGAEETARTHSQQLRAYKSQTQRLALIGGTALGVAIALAGVRILHPLLGPAGASPGWQRAALTAIDVLLTGALLGGGSHGVHRALKTLTDLVASAPDPGRGPTSAGSMKQ